MNIWFYYDSQGNRRGPINDNQFKELVRQGQILPETKMETTTGNKGLARQVPGVFPQQRGPFETSQPGGQQTQRPLQGQASPAGGPNRVCTNCGKPVGPQAVACMSCGASPIGHRKFCHICGSSLNPEQIICTQCKSPIGQQQPYNKGFPAYPPCVNAAPTIKRTDTDDEDEEPIRSWKRTFFYLSIPGYHDRRFHCSVFIPS